MIGIVGLGNMGTAFLRGLLHTGHKVSEIRAVTRREDHAAALRTEFGIEASTDAKNMLENCDTIVLAVKPHDLDHALSQIGSYTENATILSFVTGATIEKLQEKLEKAQIVRVAANIHCERGSGVFAYACDSETTDADKKRVKTLFDSMGTSFEVTEDKIPAMIGLVGSTPALLYGLFEQVVAEFEALGIAQREARELSATLVAGSGEMMKQASCRDLIERICTKKGVTQQGMDFLKAGDVFKKFAEALHQMTQKSKELETHLNPQRKEESHA